MPDGNVRFDDLRGWADDDHSVAFAAFQLSAERHLERPFKSRAASALDGFDQVAKAARGATDARAFFEEHFAVRVAGEGKLTGYYEPVVTASPGETKDFPVPLHARPPELVDLPGPDMRYGVVRDGRSEPYHDRKAIQRGALEGRGLEIAWLRDPVEAFIVHVQGSARLDMTDGSTRRVTYAAKSGHPYTSLGAELLRRRREEEPDLPATAITADVLTEWMRMHPTELDDFLALNQSYIFFEEATAEGIGPVAAAKVPLTPGRSLAVDRTLHSFGLPFWIESAPLPEDAGPAARLVVAQDTGSAIVGAARGDLFVGSGAVAGRAAGAINHPTRFSVLLPKSLL